MISDLGRLGFSASSQARDGQQITLVPDCLDDYIATDNPVRTIEVFVDELDLTTLRFAGMVPEATGRPVYHSAALLKIYLYGYLNRAAAPAPCSTAVMAKGFDHDQAEVEALRAALAAAEARADQAEAAMAVAVARTSDDAALIAHLGLRP